MSEAVLVALIVAFPPTITALVSLVLSVRIHRRAGEIHVLVNSKMTAALAEIEALKKQLKEGAR